MLEKIKYGQKLGDFNEKFVDNLIKLIHEYELLELERQVILEQKKKRLKYFKQGRLFIEDGPEYEWYFNDDSYRINMLYTELKSDLWSIVNGFYQLDRHEKEDIIWSSIWKVYKEYDILYNDLSRLIYRTIKRSCIDMVRTKERVKRGNGEKPIYLDDTRDDKPQIQIECREKAYDTVDMIDWLEQIKPSLSNIEYEYIKLIITEPHFDKIKKVEICKELNISRPSLDKLIKNLKLNNNITELRKN